MVTFNQRSFESDQQGMNSISTVRYNYGRGSSSLIVIPVIVVVIIMTIYDQPISDPSLYRPSRTADKLYPRVCVLCPSSGTLSHNFYTNCCVHTSVRGCVSCLITPQVLLFNPKYHYIVVQGLVYGLCL